jgi:hypothetical protein
MVGELLPATLATNALGMWSLHRLLLRPHRQYQWRLPGVWDAGPTEVGGRRVRRRLFTAASAISLLLCMATAALWVRSLELGDVLWRTRFDTSGDYIGFDQFIFTRGRLVFESGRLDHPVAVPLSNRLGHSRWANSLPLPFILSRYGLQSQTHRYASDDPRPHQPLLVGTIRDVVIPLYLPLLAFGVLPCAWAIARRWQQLRERLRAGRCLVCSYDLTGNTSGVCPECGTPVAGEGQRSEVRR